MTSLCFSLCHHAAASKLASAQLLQQQLRHLAVWALAAASSPQQQQQRLWTSQRLHCSSWPKAQMRLVRSNHSAAVAAEDDDAYSGWATGTAHNTATSAAAAARPPACSILSSASGHRARVLDGKAVAAAWSAELQQQVTELNRVLNRRPGLAVVLVGNRPDSLIYVTRKQEACRVIGIHCRVLRLPDHVSQADLQAAVAEVSSDRAIDGVLVQLPLPQHLDEEAVMEALDPTKDVDGFHPLNMGRMLMRGRAPRFVPATPLGVVELLARSGVSLTGRTAVVLGDSNIVGGPIAALLRDAGAALVTICHRVSLQDWVEQQRLQDLQQRAAAADVCLPRLFGPAPAAEAGQQPASPTEAAAAATAEPARAQPGAPPPEASLANSSGSSSGSSSSSRFQSRHLPGICRTADILVVAVGSPELVRADWVKPGAVVVDVGINVVPGGSARGPQRGGQRQQQQQQQQQQEGQEGQQQQQQEGQQGAPAVGGTSRSRGVHVSSHGSSSSSSSPTVGCKPQVQLRLVQEAADGAASLAGEYSVVGDVAHEEVARVASVLTPVPGGVGPMTIAAVLHNTLQAARYRAGLAKW